MTEAEHPKPTAPLLATKGDWVAFGVAALLVLSFYYWTAATSDGLPPWPMGKASYSDYYNLLLHGILKGISTSTSRWIRRCWRQPIPTIRGCGSPWLDGGLQLLQGALLRVLRSGPGARVHASVQAADGR